MEQENNSRLDLVVGRCSKNDGYTVYRNANKEMVEEIKKMCKIPREIFSTHSHKNARIVGELDEIQRLCVDENNKNFVCTVKQIEESFNENLIQEINEKFSVADVLNETFGTIYSSDGFNYLKFKVHEKEHVDSPLRCSNSKIGLDIEKNSNYGITLKENSGKWYSMMFCYLNEDGNIVNRDYNIDLTSYLKNKSKTKEDLINQIVEWIPNIPYVNYKDSWFSKEFAFTLYLKENYDEDREEIIFNLLKTPVRSNGSYGNYSKGAFKMPKKNTVNVDKIDILKKILPLINEMEYCGDKVDLEKYFIHNVKL